MKEYTITRETHYDFEVRVDGNSDRLSVYGGKSVVTIVYIDTNVLKTGYRIHVPKDFLLPLADVLLRLAQEEGQ
jgi:hypothetical protein